MRLSFEEKTRKKTFWESKGWIIVALIGSVFLGLTTFCMGFASVSGLLSKYLMSLGFLVSCTIYLVLCLYQNMRDHGYLFSCKNSDFYQTDVDTGKKYFWWAGMFGMIGGGLCSFFGSICMGLTFEYAVRSGLNQGVTSTLFVLSSVFIAILNFLVLKETLDLAQSGGMIMLIACAIVLSYSGEAELI